MEVKKEAASFSKFIKYAPHLFVPGANWLIQIVNDLIITTLKTKHESTELPFIECGDPEKYEVNMFLNTGCC